MQDENSESSTNIDIERTSNNETPPLVGTNPTRGFSFADIFAKISFRSVLVAAALRSVSFHQT